MILILIISIFVIFIGLIVKFKLLGYILYLLPYIIRHIQNIKNKKSNSSKTEIFDEKEAYEILGLNIGDNIDQIEEAYRELMKKNHPDSGGSEYIAKKI
ncbi:MAG: hypothetical protein CML91_01195, partial [Rhodobiaceae bacterium]|nr:hypothetical protein [Rhodobiaceae bacterium]